jgi:type IV pilus assembly protein PilM
MGFFNKKRLCLEIRLNKIRYVYGKYNKGSFIIDKIGQVSLNGYGGIVENEETYKAIQNILEVENIKEKHVYITISNPNIILRNSKLPYMNEKDMRMFLDNEGSKYLPAKTEESIIEYISLDKEYEENKVFLNTTIMSLPIKIKDKIIEDLKKVKLKLKVLDVYPNSILRFFKKTNINDYAVLDLNKRNLEFMIVSAEKIFMYSNVQIEEFSPSHKVEDFINSNGISEEEDFFEGIEKIIEYTKSYLNYFATRHFGKPLERVYIIGEITYIPNIVDYMEAQCGVKTELGMVALINKFSKMKDREYNTCEYANVLSLLLRGD